MLYAQATSFQDIHMLQNMESHLYLQRQDKLTKSILILH